MRPGHALRVLRRAAGQWSKGHTAFLAAALAFHTLLALSPLLLVLLALASPFLAPAALEGRIVASAARVIGPNAAGFIEGLFVERRFADAATLAGLAGAVFAVFAASNVVHVMKQALNTVWGVPAGLGNIRALVLGRFQSLLVLLVLVFVMVGWFTLDTALSLFGQLLQHLYHAPLPVGHAVTFLASVAFNAVVFAFFYRFVPDAPVEWRDVGFGAVLAATLFTIGKALLVVWFEISGVVKAYGAAGSIVAVLLWFYWSGQIFLFGAEVCAAWAHMRGARLGLPAVRL